MSKAQQEENPEVQYVQLSEAQLDEVADRAADKVIAIVQLEIGKGALRVLLYVAGAAVVAAVAWLTAHGFIKP